MRSLPKALSRWEAELAFLPDPLALALGGMLPKLAMLVGPLARSTTKTGEPDGYAQLSRRGPFDRLLLTQWALLDVMPEELLRRAASNELLFHELARKEPKTSQQSIALFDMGPMLLGAPRLAEMALLIVLARRAQDAGVPFQWGILGSAQVHEYQGECSLRALLDARSAELPKLDERAPSQGTQKKDTIDDIWLIGHETSLPWNTLRASSQILLDEVIKPGIAQAETLSVVVRRAGKEATQALALKLPAPEICTALMRSPATTKTSVPPARSERVASTAELAKGTELQFSRDGNKLLARTKDGNIAVFTIPNLWGESPKRPYIARPPQGYELIACGTAGRRVVLIVRMKGDLYVRGLRGGPQDHLERLFADPEAQPLEPTELRPVYVGVAHPPSMRIPDVCFEPRPGQLIWASGLADGRHEVFEIYSALPLAAHPAGMAIIRQDASTLDFARLVTRTSRAAADTLMTTFAGSLPIVIGGSSLGQAMAAERTKVGARVFDIVPQKNTTIALPEDARLVGVTSTSRGPAGDWYPLVITATKTELVLHRAGGEHARILFDEELARIVCSPRGPRAAVMLVDGAIEVIDLNRRTRPLRVHSPAPEGDVL